MADRPPLIGIFSFLLNWLLPSNYLKTTFYLNVIARPRKAIRFWINGFYRIDYIYDVLMEFKREYKGNFSILEFGTGDGHVFTKMLYATKYLHMGDRVIVHTFDSFEGLPEPINSKDQGQIRDQQWFKGEYRGDYQKLEEYCRRRYKNYQIHKGYFKETLTDEFLSSLKNHLPILVWIDCDYYSSAKTVFKRLIPYLPNGCVIYFDDIDFNFGSRLSGESALIYEINNGLFGDGIELALDRKLSLDSNRVYRFIRFESDIQYEPLSNRRPLQPLRRINDSPMP